ncbi:MAG TPA: hypothetical protein VH637_05460, partial [Streptosporangiaceae bacterium]
MRFRRAWIVLGASALLTAAAVGFPGPAAARPAAAGSGLGSPPATAGHGYRRACALPSVAGWASCLALVRTNVTQRPQAAIGPGQAPAGVGFGPADLQNAYDLPSATAGAGETVAVVDAFD